MEGTGNVCAPKWVLEEHKRKQIEEKGCLFGARQLLDIFLEIFFVSYRAMLRLRLCSRYNHKPIQTFASNKSLFPKLSPIDETYKLTNF